MKRILFLLFMLSAGFCFSAPDTIRISGTPPLSYKTHFIKLDVFKSLTGQVHVSYEYFNGKHGGIEIGGGVYYVNDLVANAFLVSGIATQGNGYEADVQRKFFLRPAHGSISISPMLRYSAHYWSDARYRVSHDYWTYVNGKEQDISLLAMFGFRPKWPEGGMSVELNAGIGIIYRDIYRSDAAEWYRENAVKRRFVLYQPAVNIGMNICFGIKPVE